MLSAVLRHVPAHPLPFSAAAYKDLAERKEVRQSAWEGPGWDECVRRTGQHVARPLHTLIC